MALNCSNCFTPKLLASESTSKTGRRQEVSFKAGVIHGASGSAVVTMAGTKVVCSVFGPKPYCSGGGPVNEGAVVDCEVRFAHFLQFRAGSFSEGNVSLNTLSATENFMSKQVKDAIEGTIRLLNYPKANISIQLVILSSGGSEIAALISSASLALANAAIELYDLSPSVTVAVSSSQINGIDTNPKQSYCINPNEEEAKKAVGTLTAAYIPSGDIFSFLLLEGSLPTEDITDILSCCREAALLQRAMMTKCLETSACS